MRIKPHAGLTSTLRVLLKITIVVAVLAVASSLYDYYSYSTLPADVDPGETMLPSDAVQAVVGLVQMVLAITTGITFLLWIYRTNKNLRALSGEVMRFTPGWSVGWWFIPIANLFKPYQVMKEIWKVSHKDQAADHAIVWWWWALWITSRYIGKVAFKFALRADDATEYARSAAICVISDGLEVALNIVALALVTRIGKAYARHIAEAATAPSRGSTQVPSLPED